MTTMSSTTRERIGAALARAVGFALCGVAAFYWSVEIQSVALPYHPFSAAATAIYVAIVACAFVLGALVACWPDQRQRSWAEATYVVLRYFLAFQMLRYGLAKIFPVQFTTWLYWDDLLARNLQPLDRAWMFFSHSRAYGLFLGGWEVVAGCLLIARRTALLGALATFAILINITIVNFEYDVPIGWDASVWTAMSVYLIAADRRKILALLSERSGEPPPRWRARLAGLAALAFIAYHSVDFYRSRYGGDWFSPVYGKWMVVDAVDRSGVKIEPSALGFDRVYFEEGSYVHVRDLNGRVPDLWTSVRGQRQPDPDRPPRASVFRQFPGERGPTRAERHRNRASTDVARSSACALSAPHQDRMTGGGEGFA